MRHLTVVVALSLLCSASNAQNLTERRMSSADIGTVVFMAPEKWTGYEGYDDLEAVSVYELSSKKDRVKLRIGAKYIDLDVRAEDATLDEQIIARLDSYLTYVLAYFSIARDGLITAIQGELKEFIVALENIIPAQNAETILLAAPIVPSISAAYFMLNIVINGALAQLILARSGRNLRPSIGFSKIALPPNLLYLLAACAVVTFISSALGPIALTLAFILVVAYFLLGLAVVHAYLKQRPNPGMALFSFYVIFILLLILFLPLGLTIVGLGIIEQAIGLRRRIAAPGAGEEEE